MSMPRSMKSKTADATLSPPVRLQAIGLTVWALLALGSTLAESAWRPLVVGTFMVSGPGLALTLVLGISGLARIAVAVASSLAISMLLAEAMVYSGRWSPITGSVGIALMTVALLAPILAGSFMAVLDAIPRRRRRTDALDVDSRAKSRGGVLGTIPHGTPFDGRNYAALRTCAAAVTERLLAEPQVSKSVALIGGDGLADELAAAITEQIVHRTGAIVQLVRLGRPSSGATLQAPGRQAGDRVSLSQKPVTADSDSIDSADPRASRRHERQGAPSDGAVEAVHQGAGTMNQRRGGRAIVRHDYSASRRPVALERHAIRARVGQLTQRGEWVVAYGESDGAFEAWFGAVSMVVLLTPEDRKVGPSPIARRLFERGSGRVALVLVAPHRNINRRRWLEWWHSRRSRTAIDASSAEWSQPDWLASDADSFFPPAVRSRSRGDSWQQATTARMGSVKDPAQRT